MGQGESTLDASGRDAMATDTSSADGDAGIPASDAGIPASDAGIPASDAGIEGEVLATVLHGLAGQPVIFEAANEYGLSAQGRGLGQQLHNTRADDHPFRVNRSTDPRHAGDSVYTIEAAPGLCIGVGQEQRWYRCRGFQSVLVRAGDPSAEFRVIPARNRSSLYFSFESVQYPGYLLNHCDGLMWIFSSPANCESTFSKDSSWKVLRAETLEQTVQRLPAVVRPLSDNAETSCPVCLEPWSDVAQVITECKHTFCMRCIVHICKLTPPSTSGTCALCRAPVHLDNLRRVLPPPPS